MKRRALLTGLLVLGCASQAAPPAPAETAPSAPAVRERPPGPLRLASGVWSPFTDVDEKPHLAIQLVQEALKRAGHEAKGSIIDPQALMPALEAGEYDGSEALWLTEERLEYMFYSRPYLENRLVLLARAGQVIRAEKVEDLKGKKLGIVKNYAYGPEVLDAIGPTFVPGDSDEDNLRALLEGKVDYIIVDELLGYYLFRYESERANRLLVAGKIPMTSRSLHFAIRKDVPNAEKIIADFNKQIDPMMRDGTYNSILKVEWLLADVDGDGRQEYVIQGTQAGEAPPEVPYTVASQDKKSTPRFIVGGELYESWDSVPGDYKVTNASLPGVLENFRPGVNAVLADF